MADNAKVLVNVKQVNFINEKTNEKFKIETSNEVGIEPIKSEGKRDILRVKNTIYGINQTEDIVIGYKLKLKDNLFNLDVMKLIDGGDKSDKDYLGTKAGETVSRDLFTVEVITEEKDYYNTIGYYKFIYKHCMGKPAKYDVKDGAFMLPEYEAESIPFRGERPVEITFIEKDNLEKDFNTKNEDKKKDFKVKEEVTKNNKDLKVDVTGVIKWTFNKAINQDDANNENFIVENKSNKEKVNGTVTIDDYKKVVTFVPFEISNAVYTATAKSVRLADGSGNTEAISVEFTTI